MAKKLPTSGSSGAGARKEQAPKKIATRQPIGKRTTKAIGKRP